MNVTRFGIYSRLAQAPSALNYSDNTINVTGSTSLFGIRMINTGTAPVNITVNHINVDANNGGNFNSCISHEDVVAANNSLVRITGNVLRLIQKGQFGIRNRNINGSFIGGNTVFCNQGTLIGLANHYGYYFYTLIPMNFIKLIV